MMGRSSAENPSAAPWTEAELDTFERQHAEGISTQQVVERFAATGAALSEATFRKYVQLGLLPRSVRVGQKGKHRGSQGFYPPTVVRQIEFIRRLMAQGHTISQIKDECALGGDIDALSRQLQVVVASVERSTLQRDAGAHLDEVLARAVSDARVMADELIGKLRAIEKRLAVRARMARAAV